MLNLKMSKNNRTEPEKEQPAEKPEGAEKPNLPASSPESDTMAGLPSMTETKFMPLSQTATGKVSNQSEENSKAGSIEADHFDALLSGGGDDLAGESGGALAVSGDNGAMIGKDDFHRLFVGGFDAAGEMSGIKAMKVTESDKRAKAASDSLYDTINDIPMLRPLLNPSNKWYGRAFNIGFFFWCMSRAVSEEIQQRQAEQQQAQTGESKAGVDIPRYNLNGKDTIQ